MSEHHSLLSASPSMLTGGQPRVSGRLDLHFLYSKSTKKTILQPIAQVPPLRVIRAFQLDDGAAMTHIHNISGGVLAGDQLSLRVTVGAQARAQLTTPGATRIYRHRQGLANAIQSNQITIESGGLLEYLPDPLIPFADSRYQQQTKIQLADDAGLFWWETVAPGREAYNEQFAYDDLEMRLDIRANTRPIALERLRLRPKQQPLTSLARLGPYRYYTTFYICRVGLDNQRWLSLEKELAQRALQHAQPGRVVWGVSTLAAHGLVVRGLSRSGRPIPSTLLDFWRIAKQNLYEQEIIPPRKLY